MRILVFGDIHGSLPTARRIVELAVKHRPNQIVLLGDILYHGPRNPIPQGYDPQACVRELTPLAERIIAVRGNCDCEVDMNLLPFPMADSFTWLFAEGLRIFATHGHTYSPQNLPPLAVGDIFLSGHTHVPTANIHKGIVLCNPGTLTNPKQDHPASYGLFDGGSFAVITQCDEVYLRLEGL